MMYAQLKTNKMCMLYETFKKYPTSIHFSQNMRKYENKIYPFKL